MPSELTTVPEPWGVPDAPEPDEPTYLQRIVRVWPFSLCLLIMYVAWFDYVVRTDSWRTVLAHWPIAPIGAGVPLDTYLTE